MITITAADSPYSFGCNTAILLVDTSGGAVEIRLPPAANALAYRSQFRVSKITTDSNLITITPFGSETINQRSSYSFRDPISLIIFPSEATFWTASAAALNPPVVSVKDFGAVGNGITDDCVAVQSAIDFLWGLGGGTLYFPFGNYLLQTGSGISADAALDLRSNITLKGEGAASVLTVVASTTQFRGLISGVGPSTDRAVAGTIALGATSFFASTTSLTADLVVNDWLNFSIFDPNYNDVIAIDFAQVNSVSGTTVNVKTPFKQTFVPGTGQNLFFQRMNANGTPVQNIEITDLSFRFQSSGLATPAVLFSFYWTRGVVLKNTVCTAVPGTTATGFVALFRSSDVRIYNNRFTVLPATIGDISAGVELAESVDVTFENNILESENSTVNGTLLAVNFGTNRFQIVNNKLNNTQNFGIITYAHPYNGVIAYNTITPVSGIGTGISLGGAEKVVVEGNILLGGVTFGIISSTDTTPTVAISPSENLIRNNIVNGFTIPYQTTYLDRCDQWQDIPYADFLFTMNVVGGLWNVSSTDFTYFRYVTNGNQRALDFGIDTTTVSGTAGSGLRISLPFAFKATSLTPIWASDSGSATMATALLAASTTMTIRRSDLVNWNNASSNNTSVQGQVFGKF